MIDLIKAAVSPALSSGGRSVREQEFDMHVIVVEFPLGADVRTVRVEQFRFFVQPTSLPFVLVRAVKEGDCSLGRLFTQSRRRSCDFLQV